MDERFRFRFEFREGFLKNGVIGSERVLNALPYAAHASANWSVLISSEIRREARKTYARRFINERDPLVIESRMERFSTLFEQSLAHLGVGREFAQRFLERVRPLAQRLEKRSHFARIGEARRAIAIRFEYWRHLYKALRIENIEPCVAICA